MNDIRVFDEVEVKDGPYRGVRGVVAVVNYDKPRYKIWVSSSIDPDGIIYTDAKLNLVKRPR
jgi:transcription antitermination factor NusG